jgi:hypothetical protein
MDQVFKDFAGPIATIIAASAAAYFARQQMVIARDKLQHDIFYRKYERRVAVYEATRKFLADVFENISEDEILTYGLCTLDAQFLFDDKLYRYLREIHWRVAAWNHARLSIEKSSGQEKAEFERIKNEHSNWIIQQGDEQTGFAAKFAPFLVHRQLERAWWLRCCNGE